MQFPIDAIIAKIAVLSAAKVEPLGIDIHYDKIAAFKYKALEGHPQPGNAKNGFSHPAIQPGQTLSDVISPIRLTPHYPMEVSPDELRAGSDELARAIGWTDARISIHVWLTDAAHKARGDAGYLAEDMTVGDHDHRIPASAEEIASWSITLARGGALVWQDYYPGENAPLGQRARYHKLKRDEQLATEEYINKRGKGQPRLSTREETITARVPMPESMHKHCMAQPRGLASYIRSLVEKDIQ